MNSCVQSYVQLPIGTNGSLIRVNTSSPLNYDYVGDIDPNVSKGNTFLGQNAGFSGANNTGFGTLALSQVTSGINNVAVGSQSLAQDTDGLANTAVGFQSLKSTTTGIANTAIGVGTLIDLTTGQQNIAIGPHAAGQNISGNYNIAIGAEAYYSSHAGSGNIAIGQFALYNENNPGLPSLPAPSEYLTNNIAIGFAAGNGFLTNESGNVCIAANGTTGSNNHTFIGNIYSKTTVNSDAQSVYVDSNGCLGTVVSSKQFKENIESIGDSDKIYQLNPVNFTYKTDITKKIHYGLIAEEVEKILPNLVIYKDDNPFSVKYDQLIPLLLKEIINLKSKIEKLKR